MVTIADLMAAKKKFEEALGEKIRSVRVSHDPRLSQEGLADRAGLSRQTVNNLEQGHIPNVSVPTIMAIARALEVPIGVLVDDEYTVEAIKALELIRALKIVPGQNSTTFKKNRK